MATGVAQKCRLFLEGREVPFISATIVAQAGQPLAASISLVPTASIKNISPKTHVMIVVMDTLAFGDANFYLAFEGEVTGRGMSRTQSSRAFTIAACDYSAYWDEAQAYCYNPNFLVGKLEDTATTAGGEPPIKAIAQAAGATQMTASSTTQSLMINLILKGKDPNGNLDLVYGCANIFNALNKINLFYKAAYARLRINERLFVSTGGNLKGVFGNLNVDDFMANFGGKQGGMTSLREMMTNIMSLIFHEFIAVPFPSKVQLPGLVGGILSAGSAPGNFLFVPDGYSIPPPNCNVIFPCMVKSFDFDDDFRAAPTRFVFRASFSQTLQGQAGVATYPIQCYPDSFSDYMFNTDTATDAEFNSELGPSTLLSSTGGSYADVIYGNNSLRAVGQTCIGTSLRESDFLTNDESIRGIHLDMETFMPSMSSLARASSLKSVQAFAHTIGQYLFFKKRFSSRNATAELLFHPFLVPGFNAIILDDSDAGQTIIAKVQNVTHHLTNAGHSTQVSFGYARDFDEVDALTGNMTEPAPPAWFDSKKFGVPAASAAATIFAQETSYLTQQSAITPEEYNARQAMDAPVIYTNLSAFYNGLLNCDAVLSYNASSNPKTNSGTVTVRGAAFLLAQKYRAIANSDSARDSFVYQTIRRPVPSLIEAMYFLRAKPSGEGVIPPEYALFVGYGSSPNFDGASDTGVLNVRRKVINLYVDELKNSVGFRG
jgi:hypothetical protein